MKNVCYRILFIKEYKRYLFISALYKNYLEIQSEHILKKIELVSGKSLSHDATQVPFYLLRMEKKLKAYSEKIKSDEIVKVIKEEMKYKAV